MPRGGQLTVQPQPERFGQPVYFLYAPFSCVEQQQGKSVMVSCYIDADHAGCHVTCHLHTGILMYGTYTGVGFQQV
jgi:hypothetical protein